MKGGVRGEEGEGGGGKWGEGGGGTWRTGCMGWVHVPPPPLATSPKLLLKLDDFSITFGAFSIFL
jgi:hypothetical protein